MSDGVVRTYHDATKHHFHRFARSLGYLDWASQPCPFRSFGGSPGRVLPPVPGASASAYRPASVTFDELYAPRPGCAAPLTLDTLGDMLRHALGLSAWKQTPYERWSLRVNPSSGNLHPTEAYVIAGAVPGLAAGAGVYHYAPDRHALETRCTFDPDGWCEAVRGVDPQQVFLVALTSIHWREAWKYGERAFRYCQHDLGHAMAALRFAASLHGWVMRLEAAWPHRALAAVIGIDRDGDYEDAEREEPGCALVVACGGSSLPPEGEWARLLDATRRGSWQGRANRLSPERMEWPRIDEVAAATEDRGIRPASSMGGGPRAALPRADAAGVPDRDPDARGLILRRRSALDFDGHSSLECQAFLQMLARTIPGAHPPWDALWWPPRIHLATFVHRIGQLDAGLYLLIRDAGRRDALQRALDPRFLWQQVSSDVPLFRLAYGDCRQLADRLCCDQAIAADGFFSLGMIAEFDASLASYGPAFYRHLFWEAGFVGQILYLEAEAAGARATGIGCFYDDPVHETLGLTGHAFQSLYHFTVGMPVEDPRLTTEPGYAWENLEGMKDT